MVDFYFSYRSPYSYFILPRVISLKAQGIEIDPASAKALKDLQKPDNLAKLEKLKIQIEKLEAIGGSSAIVPSEGVVFKYKGNI